jgi:predicted ATPase
MIRELHISNYKTLHNFAINVGRFNVFIGENGCGKSNILEAIALAAAAAFDKLDNEFLASRGIRVTDSNLMRSAFLNSELQDTIKISICFDDLTFEQPYTLFNDNQPYSKWTRVESVLSKIPEMWMDISRNNEKLQSQIIELEETKDEVVKIKDKIDKKKLKEIYSKIEVTNSLIAKHKNKYSEIENRIFKITSNLLEVENEKVNEYLGVSGDILSNEKLIRDFVIFSPENTALRNFYKEGQIEPLGVNGEGLLKLLKVIQKNSNEKLLEIRSALNVFDWYADLEIPEELSLAEDKVIITDRYLDKVFDQRSANEGFLFVLFYLALMISDDTPKTFAIDNIDAALNPKLCTKLIKELIRLAKKYNKQVFVTTHNPAILDGIDLGEEDQRLFVTSRNRQGHTRYKRINLKNKPVSSTGEELKLSEAFLRGYLGGLPKGF